jgi:hypothetical protein
MRSTKVDNFLNQAIDEMFKSVGFEAFDKEFSKQKAWYTLRTWSPAQEASFKTWFIDKAKKDLKWSDKSAQHEYSFFNLMYGWSIEDNSTKHLEAMPTTTENA